MSRWLSWIFNCLFIFFLMFGFVCVLFCFFFPPCPGHPVRTNMRNKLWLQSISFFLLFQYSKFPDTSFGLYTHRIYLGGHWCRLCRDVHGTRLPWGSKHKIGYQGDGSLGWVIGEAPWAVEDRHKKVQSSARLHTTPGSSPSGESAEVVLALHWNISCWR